MQAREILLTLPQNKLICVIKTRTLQGNPVGGMVTYQRGNHIEPSSTKHYPLIFNPHKPQNLLATQNNCVEQPSVQQQLGQRKMKLSHDRRHVWKLIVLFSDQIHPPLFLLRPSLTGYTLHAAWQITRSLVFLEDKMQPARIDRVLPTFQALAVPKNEANPGP